MKIQKHIFFEQIGTEGCMIGAHSVELFFQEPKWWIATVSFDEMWEVWRLSSSLNTDIAKESFTRLNKSYVHQKFIVDGKSILEGAN